MCYFDCVRVTRKYPAPDTGLTTHHSELMNGAAMHFIRVKVSCISAVHADHWVVVVAIHRNRNIVLYTPLH